MTMEMGRFILAVLLLIFIDSCKNKTSVENETDSLENRPNIIYILADDLGYGDLSCYGQKYFTTPNIDLLRENGMKFTQAYSGATVCAPARSALMTGYHTGNTPIRGNFNFKDERVALPDSAITVAEILKQAGYKTGLFGKWGLGEPGTQGVPTNQGFDVFRGFLNQKRAHSYYPDYLWENSSKVIFEGNSEVESDYAADWYFEEMLKFIRNNKEKPFFAYLATQIPHTAFQTTNNEKVLEDWPEDYQTYVQMIRGLDQQVGKIRKLLDSLSILDNTLIIFTSDNGPAQKQKPQKINDDFDPLNSQRNLRGYKRDLYEGGIRVPSIASWPNKIEKSTESDAIWAFWDFLPTIAELVNVTPPGDIDGKSILPVLLGEEDNEKRKLYWEFHFTNENPEMKMAMRKGKWKIVKNSLHNKVELYNLSKDPSETKNVADQFPEIANKLEQEMYQERSFSKNWPITVN